MKTPNTLEEYEPYFGWCDVDGCKNEGVSGGRCWSNTGYWTVCRKHSSEYRAGEKQPPMKKNAIDREKNQNNNNYGYKNKHSIKR